MITLFHWDFPEVLQREYNGFLSSKVIQDFGVYANVCFRYFGDRVKLWITHNEAW
jgi:beta-glucosidase